MAKPLSPSTLDALNTARRSIDDLSPVQLFELSTQGLLELDGSGGLTLSKKANRGETRSTRKAEIEAIEGQGCTQAVGLQTVGNGPDELSRFGVSDLAANGHPVPRKAGRERVAFRALAKSNRSNGSRGAGHMDVWRPRKS